ncbi:MAG: hypothetical protein Q4A66_05215 [Eubacteriales bacterium]|nr:hypothetical protein [Eubacteriales bacterium]
MNKNPFKTLYAEHPAVVCHALVLAAALPVHCALHALVARSPSLLAAVEPLIAYIPIPLYLYLFIRSTNRALERPCREATRSLLFFYRILLIVLLLSMLSYLVLTLTGLLLAPLLPKR